MTSDYGSYALGIILYHLLNDYNVYDATFKTPSSMVAFFDARIASDSFEHV